MCNSTQVKRTEQDFKSVSTYQLEFYAHCYVIYNLGRILAKHGIRLKNFNPLFQFSYIIYQTSVMNHLVIT